MKMAQARLARFARQLSGTSNNVSAGGLDGQLSSKYEVLEQPLGSTRYVRIVCIGAGASGLNLIHTLKLHLTDYELTVYEKNPQVGGTWFENRYPGCKCDIPSHNYQFTWKRNPEWSSFFSPAEEINAYLCRLCDEENMRSVIKCEHRVVEARWDEQSGTWRLKVLNSNTGGVFDDYCHFLLNGSGILNNWKWPDIHGLQSFSGELVHSADWPENFEYAGKTVAVIGNGSSGVQIMPPVQKGARKVVHFIREPTWVVPPRVETLALSRASSMMSEIELNEDNEFTPGQIDRFKSDPDFYLKFIKAIEVEVNSNFPVVLKDSDYASAATELARSYMASILGNDARLCDALIPKFELGCRRLTPAVGYLECLQASNVTVVMESIVEVLPGGIRTSSGEFFELDAIICATGFNVSFCPRFPITGRNGNLQDLWARTLPKAYMSCAVPDMPNYFSQLGFYISATFYPHRPRMQDLFELTGCVVFLGPNAPIGHGSVFTITEYIAKYAVRVIRKCQTEGIKAICPSQSAVNELAQHTQKFMPRTAWAGSCRSWFKSDLVDGRVTALHPGSRIHFLHMLENFRGEDWEYTYLDGCNRFRYLGNGFSTKETEDFDSTWYLNEPDKPI